MIPLLSDSSHQGVGFGVNRIREDPEPEQVNGARLRAVL